MSVIYIAGPITGVKHYQRNFRAAELRLKLAGYTVFNPAKLRKVFLGKCTCRYVMP